jgi:hypothetical protein
MSRVSEFRPAWGREPAGCRGRLQIFNDGVTAGDGWRMVRYAGVMRYPDGGGLTAAEREPQQVAEIVDRQLDRLFGA